MRWTFVAQIDWISRKKSETEEAFSPFCTCSSSQASEQHRTFLCPHMSLRDRGPQSRLIGHGPENERELTEVTKSLPLPRSPLHLPANSHLSPTSNPSD